MNKNFCIDIHSKKIRVYDKTWYEINGKPHPSSTTILQAKAKGYALEKWYKQLGLNADEASKAAMDEGSNVHDMCESYLYGNTVTFEPGVTKFYEEWLPFQRFISFCKEYTPIPFLIEQQVYSEKHTYAGTLDFFGLICDKGKWRLALIDFKRSKQTNASYDYQIASYLSAFNEMGLMKELTANPYIKDLLIKYKVGDVINPYVLLLGKTTKKGWQFIKTDNWEKKMDCFLAVKHIWEDDNPNYNKIAETYPMEVSNEFYLQNFNKLNEGEK